MNCNFREGGRLFLVRCPRCGIENHAMAVASGQCAWCGWSEPEEWNGMTDAQKDAAMTKIALERLEREA